MIFCEKGCDTLVVVEIRGYFCTTQLQNLADGGHTFLTSVLVVILQDSFLLDVLRRRRR